MRLGERFGAAKCIGTRLNCMVVNGEMPNHDAQMHRPMALCCSAGLGNVPGERQGCQGGVSGGLWQQFLPVRNREADVGALVPGRRNMHGVFRAIDMFEAKIGIAQADAFRVRFDLALFEQ